MDTGKIKSAFKKVKLDLDFIKKNLERNHRKSKLQDEVIVKLEKEVEILRKKVAELEEKKKKGPGRPKKQ